MIWMIFFGFFIGSLLALILAGAILYLARRTVYTDWYRGMYKRYGCDASGVTGGVTGSEFGNTTTAGGTIGGTTLGGNTTGGLSAMGTTGGGTTSGGTSTMGTTSGTSAGDMVTM
ncbi:unnamed protein product [Angiostrongylus costaricensis]|uniref:Uncharacterized protein n=1 Tax=Angiostrongylus costaricensis TaxID=334426 RepID=A0A0R3PQS5_ANGCS|nr:unnamed protein product [Angiostrongylus costaricensis]